MKRYILPTLLLLALAGSAQANPGGVAFVRGRAFVPAPRVVVRQRVFAPQVYAPRVAFGVGFGASASFGYGASFQRQRVFAPAAYGVGGYGAASFYAPPRQFIYPPVAAPCYPPQVPVPVPAPCAPCAPQVPGCYSIQQGFAPGYGYGAASFGLQRQRFLGGY